MSTKSGQPMTVIFTTSNAETGAAADAQDTPVGTLYTNGVANAALVTVNYIDLGMYRATFTLPTLAAGDVASLRVAATVGGVAAKGVVWQSVVDTMRVSDISGAGSVSWTYTLLTPTSVPIADARVYVTTDVGGGNIVASGRTNTFGKVVFSLYPGTYYIWCAKSGYEFDNPDTEVVA